MTWTVKFLADVDSGEIGLLTAVHNAGLSDEFSYSARPNISKANEVSHFVDEAKKYLSVRNTKNQAVEALAPTLQFIIDELNK